MHADLGRQKSKKGRGAGEKSGGQRGSGEEGARGVVDMDGRRARDVGEWFDSSEPYEGVVAKPG